MRPYIGVTGITTAEEAFFARRCAPKPPWPNLMIGVLASCKSLRGIPMKERWAKQTPTLEAIPDIFRPYPGTLQLVHYSGEETMLADMLTVEKLISEFLSNYDGFQLNIAWPKPLALETFHRKTKENRVIVLQISKAALDEEFNSRPCVVRRLWDYVGLADAILLDMSGGMGKAMDFPITLDWLRTFNEADLPFSLGVAGGLGPGELLDPVRELIKEFPNLSWDAQGRLRNEQNELDPNAVAGYLEQSYALVR